MAFKTHPDFSRNPAEQALLSAVNSFGSDNFEDPSQKAEVIVRAARLYRDFLTKQSPPVAAKPAKAKTVKRRRAA